MPTATTAGLFSIYNAGPLTTTWTAPESCSTAAISERGLAYPQWNWLINFPVDTCEVKTIPDECRPNGERLNEVYSSAGNDAFSLRHYYSPALHCPDAWETVGVIAMNSGNASATGLFRPSVFSTGASGEPSDFPYVDFEANMMTSALAPAETAVACCPSGYSADPFVGCYSNFPASEIAGSSGCIRSYTGTWERPGVITPYPVTFEYFGTTTTWMNRDIPTPPSGYESDLATQTTTLGPDGLPTESNAAARASNGTWQGVAYASPMYLVHGGGNGTEGEEEEEEGDGSSAASSWKMAGGILAAWGISAIAGVGLLVAW